MSLNIFDAITSVNPVFKTRIRSAKPFAVIDTETTGVLPSADRIIEIAIISASFDGTIEQEFVTLINPSRDLGPTNKHGIRAKDVSDAPSFEDVAGDIIERLRDRTIIGHNVSFDIGMLNGEFERLGHCLKDLPHICTRRLAYEFGPTSRKLSECCAFFGIDPGRSHSALDDAHATLKLYQEYMKLAREQGLNNPTELNAFRDGDTSVVWPVIKPSGRTKKRSEGGEEVHPYLARVIANLPDTGNADFAAYFSVLDRALEDRILTENEVTALHALAETAGFTKDTIVDAHEEYFRHLTRAALEDGTISDSELEDLHSVGALLGLIQSRRSELINLVKGLLRQSTPNLAGCSASPIQTSSNELKPTLDKPTETTTTTSSTSSSHIHELTGKRVCFTGALASKINGVELTRELAIKLATEQGLVATDSVTKKTEILVVADPHTMSGKAKKAREYGIRIVADRVFWKMIGVKID